MIFCPHITEEAKIQFNQKYSEEFQKFVDSLSCRECLGNVQAFQEDILKAEAA